MSLKAIGSQLRLLVNMPLETEEDLAWWEERAKVFEEYVQVNYPEAWDLLPHGLHHYLADADIRLRDHEYAARQQKQARQLLHALENNEVSVWSS